MTTEYYKQNPVSGLRICEKGECDSLGSTSDGKCNAEEDINSCDTSSTKA
jgi:hypothetical protein